MGDSWRDCSANHTSSQKFLDTIENPCSVWAKRHPRSGKLEQMPLLGPGRGSAVSNSFELESDWRLQAHEVLKKKPGSFIVSWLLTLFLFYQSLSKEGRGFTVAPGLFKAFLESHENQGRALPHC